MALFRVVLRSSVAEQYVLAGIAAGIVAAAVEMLPVLTIQASLGVPPLRVFQSIAGGVLGAATYSGGWSTALLGVAFHILISVVTGLSFAIATAREPRLLSRPIASAMAIGLIAYLVMTFVVLPLSAVPFPANRNPIMMASSLAIHITAFGLPIVLVCRWLIRSAPFDPSERVTDRSRLVPLAVIGLLLAFGLPELGLPKLLFAGTHLGSRIGREIVWIGFAVIILLWVTKVERLPLSSIGIVKPTARTFGWAAAATAALMATAMLAFALIIPALGLQQDVTKTGAVVQVPLWLMLLTPFVAGVSEEILYRGYAIERLGFLTGRRWLAGLLAGAAFLLLHASWGAAQLIVVLFGTVIFVGLYLWKRDLPCVMIAHVMADLIGFALARAQM